MKQAQVVYSGMVQGVGFRYTVRRFAHELGVVGWVKNLPDGRVEILAEGEHSALESLIQQVDQYFRDHIRNKDITCRDPQGTFADFTIAF